MEKKDKEKDKKCFIIMPFTSPVGYEEKHFSRVYDYIIVPACKKAGFEPVIAKDTAKTNLIALEILKCIVEYDMALCDISSRNPNVFYELGLRHAFNKKTVLLKDKRTEMPFDIASLRYTEYNESLRVDEVQKAVEMVSKSLKDTYEAKRNDGNSLVQLLAIDEAKLPAGFKMSEDTSLILNELRTLKQIVSDNRPSHTFSYYDGFLSDGKDIRLTTTPGRIFNPTGMRLNKTNNFHLDDNSGLRFSVDLQEENKDK